jgi:beta-glucanase (GH16 family)
MKVLHFMAGMSAAILALSACAGQGFRGAVSGHESVGWQFSAAPVWRDEFDYEGAPDPARWGHDLGGHGWGNNELQHYTDRQANARVGNGVLVITARREPVDDNRFTSARLVSKGKGDFLYGRFEVRARLPGGRGTWPAIWMLPTDRAYGDWPRSGEIDIMEHVGHEPGVVHASVHTGAYNHRIGTQKSASRRVEDVTGTFHVYRVDWTPRDIRAFIDDEQVLAFANDGSGPDAWPFDQRFHLLLNIAVGGDWGGKEGVDDQAFPAVMEVDWVRVYALEQR